MSFQTGMSRVSFQTDRSRLLSLSVSLLLILLILLNPCCSASNPYDGMGSDGGCKDEYNEFAKEMNPSETNSSMKLLKKMKPLNKKSSLTLAERKNECWKITMK